MTIEASILALAEAIKYHADALRAVATVAPAAAATPAPAAAAAAATETVEKPKRQTKTKVVETPADEQVETEPAPEKEERPAPETKAKADKPAAFDAEKCKADIRAVFQQLAAKNPDLPIQVLKDEGIDPPRISGASVEQLPALLLAARAKLQDATSYE